MKMKTKLLTLSAILVFSTSALQAQIGIGLSGRRKFPEYER